MLGFNPGPRHVAFRSNRHVADGKKNTCRHVWPLCAVFHQRPHRSPNHRGTLMYGRSETGGFVLKPDAEGDLWSPDWPVWLVDWHAACAYAEWMAQRTGQPWRLPVEMEWEKAGRGVDGRFFPWGDAHDPSWCR